MIEKLGAAEESAAHSQFVGPNPDKGVCAFCASGWLDGWVVGGRVRSNHAPPLPLAPRCPAAGSEGNSEKKRHMKTSHHHITGGFRSDKTPDVDRR